MDDRRSRRKCAGSPISSLAAAVLALSIAACGGVIDDAVGNGEFFIRGVGGESIGGTIPTDANGAFGFTAPLFRGVQTVKCVWSNEAGRFVFVTEVTRDDCENADIRITPNWDELGLDYELHLDVVHRNRPRLGRGR